MVAVGNRNDVAEAVSKLPELERDCDKGSTAVPTPALSFVP